jgi:hypothetical protein
VVAGHPHDHGEPLAEQGQRADDVVDPLGHVAGHDQPVVVGRRPQPRDDRPVLGMAHVQVGDGDQAGSGHRLLFLPVAGRFRWVP